jgi:hypothetical protein
MFVSLLTEVLPLAGTAPPGVGDDVTLVIAWVKWIVFAVVGMVFVIAGGMIAFGALRGEGSQHTSRLGWIMLGCSVIGGATLLSNALTG